MMLPGTVAKRHPTLFWRPGPSLQILVFMVSLFKSTTKGTLLTIWNPPERPMCRKNIIFQDLSVRFHVGKSHSRTPQSSCWMVENSKRNALGFNRFPQKERQGPTVENDNPERTMAKNDPPHPTHTHTRTHARTHTHAHTHTHTHTHTHLHPPTPPHPPNPPPTQPLFYLAVGQNPNRTPSEHPNLY